MNDKDEEMIPLETVRKFWDAVNVACGRLQSAVAGEFHIQKWTNAYVHFVDEIAGATERLRQEANLEDQTIQ